MAKRNRDPSLEKGNLEELCQGVKRLHTIAPENIGELTRIEMPKGLHIISSDSHHKEHPRNLQPILGQHHELNTLETNEIGPYFDQNKHQGWDYETANKLLHDLHQARLGRIHQHTSDGNPSG